MFLWIDISLVEFNSSILISCSPLSCSNQCTFVSQSYLIISTLWRWVKFLRRFLFIYLFAVYLFSCLLPGDVCLTQFWFIAWLMIKVHKNKWQKINIPSYLLLCLTSRLNIPGNFRLERKVNVLVQLFCVCFQVEF